MSSITCAFRPAIRLAVAKLLGCIFVLHFLCVQPALVMAADVPHQISAPTANSAFPGMWTTSVTQKSNISKGDVVLLTLQAPTQAGYWHHLKITFGSSIGTESFAVYSADGKLAVYESGADFPVAKVPLAVPVKRYDFPFEGTLSEFERKGQSIYFNHDSTGAVTLRLVAKGSSGTWKYTVQGFYRVPSADDLSAPVVAVSSASPALLAGDSLNLTISANPAASSSIVRVELFDNETLIGEVPVVGAGPWTHSLENLGPGRHRFSARAVDSSGRSAHSPRTDVFVDWLAVRVNFRPSAAVSNEPADYVADTGAIFGRQAGLWTSFLHFGWSRALQAQSLVRRNRDIDVRFDSYAVMRDASGEATEWNLRVPPGKYLVQLCVGDSEYGGERYGIQIEDQIRTVSTSKTVRVGWHEIVEAEVAVSDGLLSIRDLGGERPAKLNYIVVEQLTSDSIYRRTSLDGFYRGTYPDIISVEALGEQRLMSASPKATASTGASLMCFYERDDRGDQDPDNDLDTWNIRGDAPVAAFGRSYGAGHIYAGKSYGFRVYAGRLGEGSGPQFRVRVLDVETKATIGTLEMAVGDLVCSTSGTSEGWAGALREGLSGSFASSSLGIGVHVARSYNDLSSPNPFWTFRITASNPNYLYILESNSVVYDKPGQSLTRLAQLGADGSYIPAAATYSPLIALDPEPPPAFASKIQAYSFEGGLMPASYYGTSESELNELEDGAVADLLNPAKSVTTLDATPLTLSAVTDPNAASLAPFKRVGSKIKTTAPWNESPNSPELRQHTLLDEFIQKNNSDPITLANFVFNEIELTDAVSFNQDYADGGCSIDAGGVKRGALGTFLERQGSPAEQCALLVYFLRNCGIPAAYVTTTRNQLLMSDSVVSRLLKVRLNGGMSVPKLVPVNYPWVMALVPKEGLQGQYHWVHLFPWIKDLEVTEGEDLYGKMPAEYRSGWNWAHKYFNADPEVLPFQLRDSDGPGSTPSKVVQVYGNPSAPYNQQSKALPREYEDISGMRDFDQPAVVWPRFLEWKLRESGFALEDVGYRVRTRTRLHSAWGDFPLPTRVAGNFSALHALSQISNIFDTIQYQITQVDAVSGRDAVVVMDTGPLLLCDVVNRKFYVERYKLGTDTTQGVRMTMGAWDPFATAQAAVTWPQGDQLGSSANFLNGYKAHQTKIVDPAPNGVLRVRIVHDRDRHNSGLKNLGTYNQDYAWRLSDAFSSSFYIQNESVPGLQEIDSNDLPRGVSALCVHVGRVTEEMLAAHLREIWRYEQTTTATSPNLDIVHGTKSFLMGMSYWQYLSEFTDRVAKLHKISLASDYGHLFAGLGLYEEAGMPLLPTIDIYRSATAGYLFNSSLVPTRLDGSIPEEVNGFDDILGCQGSAYEHGVIDRYFGSLGAISTMRLFHMAKDRNDALVEITKDNYQSVLDSQSLVHEAQGRNISNPPTLLRDIPFFADKIRSFFDGVSLAERQSANVLYLAPKFYEFYDEKGFKMESAGLAPIPALGRMGGLIQKSNELAHYTYTADITPASYGKFEVGGVLYDGISTQWAAEGTEVTLTVAPTLFDAANNGYKVVKRWRVVTTASNGAITKTDIGDGNTKTIEFTQTDSWLVRTSPTGVITRSIPTSGASKDKVHIEVEMDDPKLPVPNAVIVREGDFYWWYKAVVSTNVAGAQIRHRTPNSSGQYPDAWLNVNNPTSMTTYRFYDNTAYSGQYKLESQGWRGSNIVQVYNNSVYVIYTP